MFLSVAESVALPWSRGEHQVNGAPWTDTYCPHRKPFTGHLGTVKIWSQRNGAVRGRWSNLAEHRAGKQERALTMNTKSGRTLLAAGLITAALASGAIGQQDQKLGKVTFPTSCDPAVQAEFDGGVAMLHSYWFLIARRKFEGILQQDPTCAMAYWGVAMDLLGNTLAATPTRADAQAAWDALEKARAIGAKTQRERDWIETLSAYFRDHDKIAVNARLAAYNDAMEQLAQRYPDDYEAQAFYALTLQASASPSDTTYANQLKSVAILEKLYEQNPQHPGVTHFIIHAYDYHP